MIDLPQEEIAPEVLEEIIEGETYEAIEKLDIKGFVAASAYVKISWEDWVGHEFIKQMQPYGMSPIIKRAILQEITALAKQRQNSANSLSQEEGPTLARGQPISQNLYQKLR